MRFLNILVAGLVLTACESPTEQQTEDPTQAQMGEGEGTQAPEAQAAADLEPLNNSTVRGSVAFTEQENAVHIVTALTGLQSGNYTLALHNGSDCSNPGPLLDQTQAAQQDRQPTAEQPEAGTEGAAGTPQAGQQQREPQDMLGHLGEVEGNGQGIANTTMEKENLTLEGTNGVTGKVVALYMEQEQGGDAALGAEGMQQDPQQQPAGAEAQPAQQLGQMVACGVIREGGQTSGAEQQGANRH